MKFLVIVFTFLALSFAESRFCRGFEMGYIEGWCYEKYACMEPLVPMCPMPTMNEDSDSFSDGYNKGFLLGLAKRR